jgi:hypothetical protein
MNSDDKLTSGNRIVLTVRDNSNPADLHLILSGLSDVTSVNYHEITPALLTERKPDLVISMAFTAEFDCLDLAMILQASGYAGCYRAIAAGLPVPAMVINEVTSLCPALDFDIIDAAPQSAEYIN